MSGNPPVPDWIYLGAEIVVYSDSHLNRDRAPDFRVVTVQRIVGQSFTVEGLDEQIKLDGLRTKSIGGSWSSWRYHAIPVGSEKHFEMQVRRRKDEAEHEAHRTFDEWMKSRRDTVRIDSAIAALATLRRELTEGPS